MSDNSYSPGKRKLYKNPDKAKICGVCAGLAEYFGFEVWVIRIIAISLLLMSIFSGMVLLLYFVLCFVLDPKPGSISSKGCFGRNKSHSARQAQQTSDTKPYRSSVKDVWKSGNSPSQMLAEIEGKFSDMEKKLQKMESYVTSSKFDLERQFKQMGE